MSGARTVLRLAVLLLITYLIPFSVQAVYKCTGEKGRVVYSDVPCPSDAQQQEIIKRRSSPPEFSRPKTNDLVTTEQGGLGAFSADAITGKFGHNDYDAYLMVKITTSDKIGEASASEAATCLDRYRQSFRDPRSAYVVSAALMRDKMETYILTDISANNGFGGRTRTKIVCPHKSDSE